MLRVASHWKATIRIYSLETFQKMQKFIVITATCPTPYMELTSLWGLRD
jgi:hypothetical protein